MKYKENSSNISSITWNIELIEAKRVVSITFPLDYKKNSVGYNESKIICDAFEYATQKNLPVIATVTSSGMKITEGTVALFQMANIAAAIKQHSDKGLLYIAIVRNTSLGGISASLVALADIIIGIKGAIYGFSGRRIIENTLNEKLPESFQTVESAKEHGMVDIVTDIDELNKNIKKY